MKIKNFFSQLKPTARAKALNYAVSARSIQRSWLEGEYDSKNTSAINTSFARVIRHCQDEWVSAPLTKLAKEHIKRHLNLDVEWATYTERAKLNKILKLKGVELLYWEHITGIQSINNELMSMEECIPSAIDMINFLSDRTLIVIKLWKSEHHLNHNTSIEELKQNM